MRNLQHKFQQMINIDDWSAYGNTHNECIQICYNETTEDKNNDEAKDKKTQIYDGNKLSDINTENQPGFDIIHSGLDYLKYSNNGFNKLNLKGKKLEEYLHNSWKYIKNQLSVDYSINNDSNIRLEKYSLIVFKNVLIVIQKIRCKFKSFNNNNIYIDKVINI